MRTWIVAIVSMALLAACGKDETPVVQIDLDTGVDGTADAAVPLDDAAGPDASVGETPRPDLEVVIVDREVSFVEGEGDQVAFEVPADAVSVTVSVTGAKGTQYTLAQWKNGDGADLVTGGWLESDTGAPSLCLSCPNRIAASESSFAAIAPNNEAVTIAPGTHYIYPYAFTSAGFVIDPLPSGTANVRVVIKRLSAAPANGVLDVNFYLTGAQGWTAATAPTDERLQGIIADVEELYAQVGIELGVITYTDIPEEFAVVESVLFGPDLQELFELSAGQPRDALNVFLVEELFLGSGPGFGVLLGVSGGIPGPPFGGTPRSGVVINTTGDPGLDIPTANVIAHEVGHHLGLFHTTESSQPIHDPIADTPQNDTSLLMYAASDGTTITAAQGAVMRSNPFVNHPEAP